eukprot:CAMPEP_0198230108 /NCGR_PEP_ID=MMETSP1445-20131203/114484_1 /TAXON_ID=36898 /ORGANISM="Pyramimonas sp., Strain CCMP2087" /LENGTH=43 /DNA_ID= /DNA_START= /DNA_END= /DNA_ORIENTATION=
MTLMNADERHSGPGQLASLMGRFVTRWDELHGPIQPASAVYWQ